MRAPHETNKFSSCSIETNKVIMTDQLYDFVYLRKEIDMKKSLCHCNLPLRFYLPIVVVVVVVDAQQR